LMVSVFVMTLKYFILIVKKQDEIGLEN